MIEILEREQLIKVIFEQIILAKVPWLLRNIEVGVDSIVPELVELFHHDAIVLLYHHLALLYQLMWVDRHHIVHVELKELEYVLQWIDEVVEVHAELIDEEGLDDLVVEEDAFGEAGGFCFLCV